MEVEKKLKIGLLLSAVVNLAILCRDYCILLEPINNIITESKKNIIIFVSFKINPITFRFSLAPHSAAKFFTEYEFVLDLILI